MTHSIPLRYALPFGFLALSTVLMALAYGLRHAEIVERNETLMRQRAAGLGAFVVPELEEEFARGAANAGDPLFGRLHSIPHLKSGAKHRVRPWGLGLTNPGATDWLRAWPAHCAWSPRSKA